MSVRMTAAGQLAARRASAWRWLAREVALLLAGTIFLALTARISVTLPFTPVPISGQTLGVLLIGALYGPRRGAVTVLAYLAQGVAGAPVFAGGRAGLPVLLGPTGGYLVGFVPAAVVAGWLGNAARPLSVRLAALVGASLLVYAVGVPWLAVTRGIGLPAAVMAGAVPFVIGDTLKVLIASGVTPAGAALLAQLGIRPR